MTSVLEVKTTFKIAPSSAWPLPSRKVTRWLAPSWTMLAVAARTCRVRNPVNGAVAELSADQFAILTACEGCKTLDEHGVGVRRKLGVPDQDWPTIWQWLSDFVARGLFVSLDDLVQRLKSGAAWSPPPFAGVVIRTRDRPPLLTRLLASAQALERRGYSRYRYQVLDDSRQAENIAANRAAVADSGLDALHHDLSADHPLAHALKREFADAGDDIQWLLGRPAPGEATYGRPVNLALLMTAGNRVIMLDDDVVLDPRLPPVLAKGLEVSSSSDELFAFGSPEELDAACAAAALDPIAAHLDALGAPVGRVWNEYLPDGGEPAIVDLRGDDALRFAADARVVVTQNHALGDPGSSLYPYHLLTLPAASLQHALAAPDRIASAFQQRHDWRGHARSRLTPNRPLTCTTLAGLDNSALLPPTVRAHRNEDLLLGDMIRYSQPAAWSFDLAWGLPHRREPAKTWLPPSASFAQEPVHFLMDYLETRAPTIVGEGPADRMRTLGALLIDLSSSSEARVLEMLEHQAADTASRVRYAIQSQLDDAALPDRWKSALRPWLDSPTLSMATAALRARLASPASVRQLAVHYGRALQVWPALWAFAARS
jgi:hypothetical protein